MELETVNMIQHFLEQKYTTYISHKEMTKLSKALKADDVTAFQIVPDNEPQFPERPYAVVYSGTLSLTNLRDYYKFRFEELNEQYEDLISSMNKLLKDR